MLPARELVTEHQINVLLALVHHFQPYLLSYRSAFGEEALPPQLDGGAHASAVSAFAAVCQRIETVLAEKERWDTKTHDMVYDNIVKLQKSQLDLQEEQRKAARAISQPHYYLKPSVKLVGGVYIATWGDPAVMGGAIVGHGSTPARALDDFNEAFHRTPEETIKFISSLDNPPPMENNPHKKRREDQE